MIVVNLVTALAPLDVGTAAHKEAWLPRLGPTAFLLELELAASPGRVDVFVLARRLGVHPRKVGEALHRLEQFHHVTLTGYEADGEPVYRLPLAHRPPYTNKAKEAP